MIPSVSLMVGAFTILSASLVLAFPPPGTGAQPLSPALPQAANATDDPGMLSPAFSAGANNTILGAWPSDGRIEIPGSHLTHGAGVQEIKAFIETKGRQCTTAEQRHEFINTFESWLQHWPQTPPAVSHDNPYPYPPAHDGQHLYLRWYQRSSVYRYDGPQYWLTSMDVVKILGWTYVRNGCLTSDVVVWITFSPRTAEKAAHPRSRPLGTLKVVVKPDAIPDRNDRS